MARFRDGFTAVPPMRALGATGDAELARAVGRVLGTELAAVGVDLDFAPVLDVDTNPDNPVIGARSFDREPGVVAELGLQESSQTAVEEGLGATFTSLAAIDRELELGRLAMARVTGLSLRRDYVVVRQAAREPSKLAAAFVAFCREA